MFNVQKKPDREYFSTKMIFWRREISRIRNKFPAQVRRARRNCRLCEHNPTARSAAANRFDQRATNPHPRIPSPVPHAE